jgi:hypothetical protein
MSNRKILESIDCCYGSRRRYGAEGGWCHCHGRCGCMLQVATLADGDYTIRDLLDKIRQVCNRIRSRGFVLTKEIGWVGVVATVRRV